jgi:hypothetical protein
MPCTCRGAPSDDSLHRRGRGRTEQAGFFLESSCYTAPMQRGDAFGALTSSRDVMEKRWMCPTCREERATRFCGGCGEKRLEHHDLTITGFVGHALESLTHVDGRVFRSVRDLIVRPGALTAAYMRGQRRPTSSITLCG